MKGRNQGEDESEGRLKDDNSVMSMVNKNHANAIRRSIDEVVFTCRRRNQNAGTGRSSHPRGQPQRRG